MFRQSGWKCHSTYLHNNTEPFPCIYQILICIFCHSELILPTGQACLNLRRGGEGGGGGGGGGGVVVHSWSHTSQSHTCNHRLHFHCTLSSIHALSCRHLSHRPLTCNEYLNRLWLSCMSWITYLITWLSCLPAFIFRPENIGCLGH